MKEHPILFSTPMVLSILQERKTQTRRIIKPQPIDNTEIDGNFFEGNHKGYVKVDNHPTWKEQYVYEFCKYEVGDILWVKELHYRFGSWKKNGLTKTGKQKWIFRADKHFTEIRYFDNPPFKVERNTHRLIGWYKRSSLFMPRKAARILLKISDITLEMVNEISEEDAIAEGVAHGEQPERKNIGGYVASMILNARSEYAALWESINGDDSWEENPWVWVITFVVT